MTSRETRVPVLLAVLVGALLAVTTAGPLGAGEAAQAVAEPRATVTRRITVPTAAFNPIADYPVPGTSAARFYNSGFHLYMDWGEGYFSAPLFFEVPSVTIVKVVLFAEDANGDGDICVHLLGSTPAIGSAQEVGMVCSSGSAPGVRSFTRTTFTNPVISGAYGPYLALNLPGTDEDGYVFYGVRIVYTR